MNKYISLNTSLRAAAKNDFDKDFFKLMNNSVFGETMVNVTYRVNIRLVTSRHIANKLPIKPNLDKNTIFCGNLLTVHMKKTQLKLDKPIYLGASILDISKTLHDVQRPLQLRQEKLWAETQTIIYRTQAVCVMR